MKLSVTKLVTKDNYQAFLDNLDLENISKLTLVKLSNSDLEIPGYELVEVDFEHKNELRNISISLAGDCDYSVYFPENVVPSFYFYKTMQDIDDSNFSAIICDFYSLVNGKDAILNVQVIGDVIVRKIDQSDNPFDLSKCVGVIHYVPQALFTVYE